ncbi:DEAD/DEAH box helicase [Lujinxingia vulgaris]|uniref:DEAD/DEAH box helicase n=1 Tax=Lujinxingia vulgaris TaxID=2600176 RepID=A0A5C6X3W8_9DELT|nr:SNF2-related protein [Lujinxingia vulgaris]TXD34242.1 DEAD/DEAH box helicase [Lujinxingia vulgaris]
MTTDFHAQYWAYTLTVQGSPDSVDGLSRAISNARVDLNPHQVDAALFALKSPLSKGVILADEVGLGKTIEAGLVISQRWAERRRHILVVVPASLRKQWQQELWEKFFIPSVVLERKAWMRLQADGKPNPFDLGDQVVICSYYFAAKHREAVSHVPWDLAVIDEAHRLRNVYKKGNKTAKALSAGLAHATKLLLTATPLQNSLMELYGLASVIDPHLFGDPASFREQFVREPDEELRNRLLKQRISEVCQRTLREQVLEYVRFTERIPVTHEFYASDAEQRLYDDVSEYLRRDTLYGLPSAQRTLMTMVLRKLLASSSFAIGATLERLLYRLRELQEDVRRGAAIDLHDDVEEDFETVEEVQDDWEHDESPDFENGDIDPELLAQEIAIIEACSQLATNIQSNAKGDALLRALSQAFEQADAVGAPKKAVVFTESRRTQDYLYRLLTSNGYEKRVVMINGSNNDEAAKAVYAEWLDRHVDDGVPTGARAVDVRAAITEEFKNNAAILLATEAAAEGVNLQFCSLVFNYDLPWNPQRVEQRIGRCHRYGQTHDVVVVNFVNERNAADRRVLDLLSEKFRLFEGVFGASDDVLGAVESGVDIERRITDIYQRCRTAEDIAAAFDELRAELDEQITTKMSETRERLLEHFDEDVQARLRVHRDLAQASLDERGRMLLNLTRHELGNDATFATDHPRFKYHGAAARHGWYSLDWRVAEAEGLVFYRVDHPLARNIIDDARQRPLTVQHLTFNYAAYGSSIAVLEPYVGRSGWLACSLLTVNSVTDEQFIVLAAITTDGEVLDGEWCRRLMRLDAMAKDVDASPPELTPAVTTQINGHLREVETRNGRYFDAEVQKLDRWSDDLKLGLERELKELDSEIRAKRKESAVALALADKLAAQREIKALEQRRNRKRRDLYEEQDKIDEQRAEIIDGIERQLRTTHAIQRLFTVQWTIQ